jgi:V-type H+-transporting ATPase subunit C
MNNANHQVKSTYDTIINWCQAHFGEVYSAWIHLKIIRAFVESVLRYSLPVNILAVFVEPNMKNEKNVKIALTNAIAKIQPTLIARKFDINVDEEDDDDFETLPFVCHKFNIIGGLLTNDK